MLGLSRNVYTICMFYLLVPSPRLGHMPWRPPASRARGQLRAHAIDLVQVSKPVAAWQVVALFGRTGFSVFVGQFSVCAAVGHQVRL